MKSSTWRHWPIFLVFFYLVLLVLGRDIAPSLEDDWTLYRSVRSDGKIVYFSRQSPWLLALDMETNDTWLVDKQSLSPSRTGPTEGVTFLEFIKAMEAASRGTDIPEKFWDLVRFDYGHPILKSSDRSLAYSELTVDYSSRFVSSDALDETSSKFLEFDDGRLLLEVSPQAVQLVRIIREVPDGRPSDDKLSFPAEDASEITEVYAATRSPHVLVTYRQADIELSKLFVVREGRVIELKSYTAEDIAVGKTMVYFAVHLDRMIVVEPTRVTTYSLEDGSLANEFISVDEPTVDVDFGFIRCTVVKDGLPYDSVYDLRSGKFILTIHRGASFSIHGWDKERRLIQAWGNFVNSITSKFLYCVENDSGETRWSCDVGDLTWVDKDHMIGFRREYGARYKIKRMLLELIDLSNGSKKEFPVSAPKGMLSPDVWLTLLFVWIASWLYFSAIHQTQRWIDAVVVIGALAIPPLSCTWILELPMGDYGVSLIVAIKYFLFSTCAWYIGFLRGILPKLRMIGLLVMAATLLRINLPELQFLGVLGGISIFLGAIRFRIVDRPSQSITEGSSSWFTSRRFVMRDFFFVVTVIAVAMGTRWGIPDEYKIMGIWRWDSEERGLNTMIFFAFGIAWISLTDYSVQRDRRLSLCLMVSLLVYVVLRYFQTSVTSFWREHFILDELSTVAFSIGVFSLWMASARVRGCRMEWPVKIGLREKELGHPDVEPAAQEGAKIEASQ